jgi:hypothetical protein
MSFFSSETHSTTTISSIQVVDLSGSTDPSRVSARDLEEKDLKKRVRSLSTLTAKMEIPACVSPSFDSTHPSPQVRDL